MTNQNSKMSSKSELIDLLLKQLNSFFFNRALKSANESKFWLGLLRNSNKANKDRTLIFNI